MSLTLSNLLSMHNTYFQWKEHTPASNNEQKSSFKGIFLYTTGQITSLTEGCKIFLEKNENEVLYLKIICYSVI